MGMEMTASSEDGKKWSASQRSNSPIVFAHAQSTNNIYLPQTVDVDPSLLPPQEIYLEGALPAQSHLLVADSAATEETAEQTTDSVNDDEAAAVVLAGKMTLSVISLDSSGKYHY